LATASKFSIVRLRARFGWLDYHADVAGGLPVAQYISGHVEIGGIVLHVIAGLYFASPTATSIGKDRLVCRSTLRLSRWLASG